ncbi:MAG: nucleotidyltransferase family protein, partial [Shewanella sp.]
ARMHSRNQDMAYTSCVDAMAHWPELETAVGVRLQSHVETNTEIDAETDHHSTHYGIELVAPFGLNSLFALKLSANPKRSLQVCQQRVATKGWLTRYPLLTCGYSS